MKKVEITKNNKGEIMAIKVNEEITMDAFLKEFIQPEIEEAFKWQKGEIKKILVAYAFMEKPVSITKLFKEIDKI